MTSWSHGLPAWLGFTVLFFIASLVKSLRLRPSLTAMMSFAYLLHIGCDLISGGLLTGSGKVKPDAKKLADAGILYKEMMLKVSLILSFFSVNNFYTLLF